MVSRRYIWNLRIPLCISIFMWRLLNNAIPLPDILQSLGFNMHSKCPFYPSCETLDHLFSLCPLADELWSFFERLLDISRSRNDEILARLQGLWSHSTESSTRGCFSQVLPAVVCWEIWKDRNLHFFEGIVTLAAQLRRLIMMNVQAIVRAWPRPSKNSDAGLPTTGLISFPAPRRPCSKQTFFWEAPPFPLTKLNMDGSSLGNPELSGGRGIIRDHSGHVLAAFSTFFGHCTSLEAEARALLEGLLNCQAHGCSWVWIEMDFKVLLDVIRVKVKCPWRIDNIVCQI
ncbi:uncharacterized protein [Coffea arabica]|uniref:Uncharacterized protein n=1 Tax=Coffea arabica TaxID=13443 RepID=A0ABM4VQG0_COFAR